MRELRKFLSAVLFIGGAGSLLTGEAALFGAVLGLLFLAVWPWRQKKSRTLQLTFRKLKTNKI